MKTILILFFVLTLIFNNYCFAEVYPQKASADSRITKVIYNPDNVTRVNVKIGFTTLIKFSANERIDNTGGLALGDPKAWDISLRQNNLFIRPVARKPNTNLTIVTNKRTYFLNLVTVHNNSATTWGIQFIYPDDAIREARQAKQNPCADLGNTFTKNIDYDYNYYAKGSKQIMPLRAYDNGEFTCLVMPQRSNLPAVFKKYSSGEEAMTNYHIKENIIIIHEVAPEYRLRLGKEVIAIKKIVKGVKNGK